jgi:Cadherin-like domain/RTX calcium-binding nonapeptide repeat (4 copies)
MSMIMDDLKIAPPYWDYWKPDTDAVEDYTNTTQNTAVTINVLANDTDKQGDSLTITKYGGDYSFKGTLTLNEDNTITYTPEKGFSGYEYFYYTVSDGNGNTDTASVGVYTAPNVDAVEDYTNTAQNAAITIDVLANDTDANGDSLIITKYGGDYWFKGTLTLNEDNTITYTPEKGFSGYENFYYTVTDANGNTDTASVGVYTAPNVDAVEDYTDTMQNTAVTINVLANDTDADGDSLKIVSYTGDWYFQGGLTLNEDNTITYTPAKNFVGYENFYYTVTDENGNTDTAYVGVYTAPSTDAGEDYTNTAIDTAVTIDVLANDTDKDNDPLTIVKYESNSYSGATITLTQDNKLLYTPVSGFVGYDGFSYSIDDGNGNTDTAWVSVYVGYTDDQGGVIEPPIYYLDGMENKAPLIKNDGNNSEDKIPSSIKTGTKKADKLEGTSGDDLIDGKEGHDTILGRGGNDTIKGDRGKDVIRGGQGDDLINGGLGDDKLFGDLGNDTLWDEQGHNRLNGGKGDDKLIVNYDAKNILTGGEGSDQFWLVVDDLEDDNLKNTTKITDFTAGEDKTADKDKIGIVGDFTFADLTFKGSTIMIDDVKLVTLKGVQANSLTENDFVFATSTDGLI